MKTKQLIDALAEFELFTLKAQKKENGKNIILFESEGKTCLLEVSGKGKDEFKTVLLSMGFLARQGEEDTAAMERNSQTISIGLGMVKAFFPEWKEGPASVLEDMVELSNRKVSGGGRRIAYKVSIYSISVMDMGGARINLVIRK